MELGLQMFGIAPVFRKDPAGFFERAAVMGYTHIEPCVALRPLEFTYGGVNPFWSPAELAEYAPLLRAQGLGLLSCHVAGGLPENREAICGLVEAYGFRQIITGCPMGDLNGQLEPFARSVKSAASEIQATGAALLLHNNAAEIRTQVEGDTFLEAVLRRCEGRVGAQVDVGWARYGGQDPLTLLQRLGGLAQSVHYKDVKPGYEALAPGRAQCCLGEGVVDVEAIYRFAVENSLPQLVDQDYSDGDFIEDLQKSAGLLRGLGGE